MSILECIVYALTHLAYPEIEIVAENLEKLLEWSMNLKYGLS